MGSEEAKEKAEFGREQRKRGPSTKQREAAEATELECSKRNSAQQKEAAERKKRKKAPEKSAVESAELSVGTVLNTQYSIPSAASSSSISATQHLQPSKRRMSRQNKLHKAGTESSMQESRHSCPLLLLLCHLRRRLRSQRSMGSRKKKLAPRSRQNKWQREARKNSMMRKCPQRPRRRALANQKVLRTKGAEPLDASKGAAGYTEARLLIRVVR